MGQVRPLLAFTSVVRGRTLVARRQGADIVVKAHGRFLSALLEWADGDRTLDDLERLAATKWGQSSFPAFLRAMLDCGVLIEASQRFFHALSPAAASGIEGAEDVLGDEGRSIHRLLTSTSAVRQSLDVPLLSLFARNAFGVGEPTLRASVLVGTQSGGFLPGRFAAAQEGPGVVRVWRMGELDWGVVYRAMREPTELTGAFAVLVLSIDLPAADTSASPLALTRGAFLAAGQAIQRVSDAAATEGLVFKTTEAYDGSRLAHLCGVDAHALLACGIVCLGAAGRKDATAPLTRRRVDLAWMTDKLDQFGRHIARARIELEAQAGLVGWGRSADAREACAIAISEAVERYAYRQVVRPLTVAEGRVLKPTVDPRELVRFSDAQYKAAHRGIVPYRDDVMRHWVQGEDAESGEAVWLPADCVFNASCLPPAARTQLLMKATSSGCASDVSLEVALSRAACELIERDAFVRHWLAQLPCATIPASSLPGEFSTRLGRLAEMGLAIDIGLLSGMFGPVVIAGISSERRGFCSIGTACGPDLVASLDRALSEAEVAAIVRLERTPPSSIGARAVATPADHGNLFAQRRHFRRAHALLRGGREEAFVRAEEQWPASVRQRLRELGRASRMLWVDLSADDAPLSLDGRRIRTVRVLIPGAIPIAFGHDALPGGMGVKASRGGTFPHPLP